VVTSEPPCDVDRQTLSRELIDDRQKADRATVMRTVVNEIVAPYVVLVRRTQTNAGSVVEPQSSFLRLFLRHPEAFSTPESLDPFMVHSPAFPTKQRGDPSVSVSTVLRRQIRQTPDQSRLAVRRLRRPSLRRPRLPYDTAGASLRNVKAILEVFDSPSPLRRAQKFPWVISLSICLSRESSATSFFRRTFSFSSSLSRFAWSLRTPPYSFRQR